MIIFLLSFLVLFVSGLAQGLANVPTASLDASREQEVVETLATQGSQQQKVAVMITHDTRLFHVCDRVIPFQTGRWITLRMGMDK
ncbi:hypothetical protein [Salicibibacter kimchii]|uniref:hypothetical protein n=1 Tax=Salicibibacter kimchii TaxID=2099786 RepID=UPI001356E56E|nr:hypothetical protein [Salicibibacter kimchii]